MSDFSESKRNTVVQIAGTSLVIAWTFIHNVTKEAAWRMQTSRMSAISHVFASVNLHRFLSSTFLSIACSPVLSLLSSCTSFDRSCQKSSRHSVFNVHSCLGMMHQRHECCSVAVFAQVWYGDFAQFVGSNIKFDCCFLVGHPASACAVNCHCGDVDIFSIVHVICFLGGILVGTFYCLFGSDVWPLEHRSTISSDCHQHQEVPSQSVDDLA